MLSSQFCLIHTLSCISLYSRPNIGELQKKDTFNANTKVRGAVTFHRYI